MKTLNLGDICEVVTKGTTPTTLGMKLNEGNVNFIKVECLSEDGQIIWEKIQNIDETTHSKLKRSQLQLGDILFSIAGSIGRMAIVTKDLLPANTNQAVAILRPKVELVDTDFLFYFLRDAKSQGDAQKRIVQSVQNNLSLGELASLSVSLPSRTTQVAVSSFMKVLDKKIYLNRTISKTLEETAQAIFKSWFIDFDPVKAKMAGEKPVGMDAATAALFPDSMEDSELGQLPKGWSVRDFGDVNNLLMGQSPPGDTYNGVGDGVPFYQGRTDFGTRFPKQRVFCTAGTRFAKTGEVLISVRAPVGDLNQAIEDCVIGRGVASAIHKSGSQAYSYALLSSLKPKLAYYNGEGTVFGAINRSDFNSLKVIEPLRHVVDLFDTVTRASNDEIRNLFVQTESLIQMRDSLLPRLISGELQIPEGLLAS